MNDTEEDKGIEGEMPTDDFDDPGAEAHPDQTPTLPVEEQPVIS